MHYVKQFHINGVDTKQVACIELHGKPNAATEGSVGVLGIDVDSPSHDVYKCIAVNGSIYTWELLSSGLSIMSATISGGGMVSVQFPYADLKTPTTYMIKVGDLIFDREGYLYQIDSLNSSYCVATYSGTQLGTYTNCNAVYPVGSIYMSTVDASPASFIGGTWERLKDRFLLGAGDGYTAGATGGSNTHAHTHDMWADIYIIGDGTEHRDNGIMLMKGKTHNTTAKFDYYLKDNNSLHRVDNTNANAWYRHGTNVDGTIGDTNHLPPYLAVYMWQRIA